ncbi:MAG: hypothetical protein WCD42_06040 [Rhizomicrobium sp.]
MHHSKARTVIIFYATVYKIGGLDVKMGQMVNKLLNLFVIKSLIVGITPATDGEVRCNLTGLREGARE